MVRKLATANCLQLLASPSTQLCSATCRWAQIMEPLELLLEINSSQKELHVSQDELVYTIEREIGLLGIDGVLAYFSCPRGECWATKTVYILQRWSEKWDSFVDVTNTDQIVDGDRLTITEELKANSSDPCSSSTPSHTPEFDAARGQVGVSLVKCDSSYRLA